jgi:hypothetical protein
MAKFSDTWDIRTDSPESYILEQMNCPINSGEICRDFRILGAQHLSHGKWRLFMALDDGRGLHSERELGAVQGTKEDVIDEMQQYKD